MNGIETYEHQVQVDAPKAVCLLSGGLDSATALAVANERGFDVTALSFRYGQRHIAELDAARALAQAGPFDHIIVDLPHWGGSALNDAIDVPKDRDTETMPNDIPVTYVPARNTIFLAVAAAIAERISATAIFIGVNALDYSGYPDCRPEFIDAFNRVLRLGTRRGVSGDALVIHAPLVNLTKKQIILLGARLGVPFGLTHSCYDPVVNGYAANGEVKAWAACGRCDSCLLRAEGFREAGLTDPTRYAENVA